MNNFKELIVWQRGIELVLEIYKITATLPATEKFGLVSQINRSAVSIPSNIAEGAGRNSDKEFINFLSIAFGSTYELETQLIILQKLTFITIEQYNKVNNQLIELQKMISKLQTSIRKKIADKN